MKPSRRPANTIARDLLSLTRAGQADRLATALVSTASRTHHGPPFYDIVGRLVDTFSLATKDRRRSLKIQEPFTLRLRDDSGLSVRSDRLDPGVRAIARAIAANIRDDQAACADQIGEACENTDLEQRIRVLAHCLIWTADLLAAEETSYPPILSCLKGSTPERPQ